MEEELLRQALNPTFLFSWKGVRHSDEKNYHCHDYLEIAYIISGEGQYRIDGKLMDVKEGDLLLFGAGTYHEAVVNHPENPAVEFFVGVTDVQFADMEANRIMWPSDSPVYHTSGELKLRLNKLCASMEAEQEITQPGRYDMLRSYVIQLLVLIVREYCSKKQGIHPKKIHKQYSFESVSRKYIVEKIMDYFEDHYEEKISLDQIAENMYLSPFYISKIFKAETGDTPIRYLINVRLEKALEILKEDRELSIQEVSARVGYDDAYHFSKLFKKHFGISPSAVRKEADGT